MTTFFRAWIRSTVTRWVKSSSFRRRKCMRRKPAISFADHCVELESRCLLTTTTISLSTSSLTITGTDNNDEITIEPNGTTYTITTKVGETSSTSATTSFSLSGSQPLIKIDLKKGNDKLILKGTAGADVIQLARTDTSGSKPVEKRQQLTSATLTNNHPMELLNIEDFELDLQDSAIDTVKLRQDFDGAAVKFTIVGGAPTSTTNSPQEFDDAIEITPVKDTSLQSRVRFDELALERFQYVTTVQDLADGADKNGLNGAQSLVFGAKTQETATDADDGKEHLYIVGRKADAIVVMEKDNSTGEWSVKDRIDRKADDEKLDLINRPSAIAISPGLVAGANSGEAEHIYVVNQNSNSLLMFKRDISTTSGDVGKLTNKTAAMMEVFIGGTKLPSHSNTTDKIDGLQFPSDVIVSPDGKNVYVAGTDASAIVIFTRAAATGKLTYKSTVKQGSGITGLDEVSALAISADGEHLYAAGTAEDGVAVFSRATDGALTWKQLIKNGDPKTTDVEGLDEVVSLTVSPDGESVYAVGREDDALVVLSRESDSGSANFGKLTYVEVHRDGLNSVDGLQEPSSVVVHPKGLRVVVTSPVEDSVAVFNRHPETGKLTFVERQGGKVRQTPPNGMDEPAEIVFSRSAKEEIDGDEAFVAVRANDAVTIMKGVGRNALIVGLSGIKTVNFKELSGSTSEADHVEFIGEGSSVDVGTKHESNKVTKTSTSTTGTVSPSAAAKAGGGSISMITETEVTKTTTNADGTTDTTVTTNTVTETREVTFLGTERIDAHAFTQLSLSPSAANSTFTIKEGVDYTEAEITEALNITGSVGGGTTPTIAVFDAAVFMIDTRAANGTDNLTFEESNNPNEITALTIETGEGTDLVKIDADVTFPGNVSIATGDFEIAAKTPPITLSAANFALMPGAQTGTMGVGTGTGQLKFDNSEVLRLKLTGDVTLGRTDAQARVELKSFNYSNVAREPLQDFDVTVYGSPIGVDGVEAGPNRLSLNGVVRASAPNEPTLLLQGDFSSPNIQLSGNISASADSDKVGRFSVSDSIMFTRVQRLRFDIDSTSSSDTAVLNGKGRTFSVKNVILDVKLLDSYLASDQDDVHTVIEVTDKDSKVTGLMLQAEPNLSRTLLEGEQFEVRGTAADGSTIIQLFEISYKGGTDNNDVVLIAKIPKVEFAAASFNVTEDDEASFVVELTRMEPLRHPSVVSLDVTGGNATAGDDYGTVFPIRIGISNEDERRRVLIRIINDSVVEPVEEIELTLSAVSNAKIGAQATTVVKISDNDGPNAPPVPTDKPQLIAPTGTTTETQPTFEWGAVQNATNYTLTVNNLTTGTNNVIRETEIRGTSFTPGNHLPGGDYRFFVQPFNDNLETTPTSLSDFRAFTINAPAAPTVRSVEGTTSVVRPQLSWTAVPGAVRYELWMVDLTNGVSPFIRDTNITTTEFTPTSDLKPGNYRFTVRGINAAGEPGAWSSNTNFTVTTPTTPGFSLNRTSLSVNESGTTDTFTVVLDIQPTTNVVLNLRSSNAGEVTVTPTTMTFTPANWNTSQTATARGLADTNPADGDVTVGLTVGVNDPSSDAAYRSISDQSVTVVNRSHNSSVPVSLSGTGRATDYVDITRTGGTGPLDVELRAADGTILSPGVGGRVSLAGYPAGDYQIAVNDVPANYTAATSPGFGQAFGDPVLPALDMDGNGSFNFANDGVLLLAHSLGNQGSQLDPFLASGSSRDGAAVATTIQQLADSLDFDGDGQFQFNSDGVLLLAYTMGIRGTALGAFRSSTATRSAADIEGRFVQLLRKSSARQQSPDAVETGFVVFNLNSMERTTNMDTTSSRQPLLAARQRLIGGDVARTKKEVGLDSQAILPPESRGNIEGSFISPVDDGFWQTINAENEFTHF